MDFNCTRGSYQQFLSANNGNQWTPPQPDQIPFDPFPNPHPTPPSFLNLHGYVPLQPHPLAVNPSVPRMYPPMLPQHHIPQYPQYQPAVQPMPHATYQPLHLTDSPRLSVMQQQFEKQQSSKIAMEIDMGNTKRGRDFSVKEREAKKLKETKMGLENKGNVHFLFQFYEKSHRRHSPDDMFKYLNGLDEMSVSSIFNTFKKINIVNEDHCYKVGVFLDYIYDYGFESFINETMVNHEFSNRSINANDINKILELRKEKSRPIQGKEEVLDPQWKEFSDLCQANSIVISDILMQIVQYIPQRRLLNRKFCTNWTVSGREMPKIISGNKRYEYVTNLIVKVNRTNYNEYSLEALCSKFPKLKKLKLNDKKYVLKEGDVTFLQKLESISLIASGIKRWANHLTGLKSLEDFGDSNLSKCTNLTHLTLHETAHLSRSVLSPLTNLKKLRLKEDEDNIDIPNSLTNLVSLSLFNDLSIIIPTKDVFEVKILSRLKKLVINRSCLTYDTMIKLTNLTHLQLGEVKNEEQSFISVLTNLTYLNLDGMVHMKHLKYCKYLTSLDVCQSDLDRSILTDLKYLSVFNGYHLRSRHFVFDEKMQSSNFLYPSFTNLASLSIKSHFKFNFKTIEWIQTLSKLRNLTLEDGMRHSIFSTLTSLTTLKGFNCGLGDFVIGLTNLRNLVISEKIDHFNLFSIIEEMAKNNKNLVFEYKNKLF